MTTPPKKWPHNMRYLRDYAAENVCDANIRTNRLRGQVLDNSVNRTELLITLGRIIEAQQRALVALKDAGAPVSLEVL